jgi:hypothetical protein
MVLTHCSFIFNLDFNPYVFLKPAKKNPATETATGFFQFYFTISDCWAACCSCSVFSCSLSSVPPHCP